MAFDILAALGSIHGVYETSTCSFCFGFFSAIWRVTITDDKAANLGPMLNRYGF
jgi:hypothetical protein